MSTFRSNREKEPWKIQHVMQTDKWPNGICAFALTIGGNNFSMGSKISRCRLERKADRLKTQSAIQRVLMVT